jgi:eukaryotic-like serine/threonine-protein kinase
MDSPEQSRYLLLGLLAFQNGFVTREQLFAAMGAWLSDKSKSLSDYLVDQEALKSDDLEILLRLVDKHMQSHENDVGKSLAAVRPSIDVLDGLQTMAISLPELAQFLVPLSIPTQKLTNRALEHTGAHSTDPNQSRQIGNYRLLQKLGEGGMGTVWMAEQEKPVRRRVAIKLIKAGIDNEQIIARFEAERQALSMMDHVNIAKIYDAGTTLSGLPYFVMELVQGIPVTNYCDSNRLSLEERLRLFTDVCSAVQHAHQKGIIHRDLKPSNILVTLYDGRPVPKVIDFGLAKALKHQTRLTDRTLFTEFGQIVGTLRYMSPEQAELTSLDIDTRTDVYSLGVLLYELLTGSTPIDTDTVANQAIYKVLESIRDNDPPRPSDRLSKSKDAISGISSQRRIEPKKLQQVLRGDLDWIVMKSLEKDRRRRYESANGLAEDVCRFLNYQPVAARPPSRTYQFNRFLRKNRGLVSSFATIFTLLILGVLGTTLFAWRAGRAESQAIIDRDAAKKAQQEAQNERELAVEAQGKAVAAEQQSAADKQNALRLLEANEANLARTYYFLALARWDADRVREARQFLNRVPSKHRKLEWNIADRLFRGGFLTLKGHKRPVLCLAFSPDGDSIVTGSWDNTLKLWDAIRGQEILTLKGHRDAVACVKFSPDGNWIISGSWDGTVRTWNARTGEEAILIDNPTPNLRSSHSRVHCVDISGDGKNIATATSGGTLRIWNAATGELVSMLATGNEYDQKAEAAQILSFAFSPDNTKLVSCGWHNPPYGEVKVWDVESGKEIADLNAHSIGFAQYANFSPDGTQVFASGNDETVFWDTVKFTQQFRIARKWAGAQSPDGTFMVDHGPENTLHVWDRFSNGTVLKLKGHTDMVECVSFSQDGSRIATGSRDNTVSIWSLRDHIKSSNLYMQTLPTKEPDVTTAVFSPDGQTLFLGNVDGSISSIDAATCELTKTNRAVYGGVTCIAHGPNGNKIASAGIGVIKVWDVTIDGQLLELHGHDPSKAINCLAFSPDGKLIASGSDDATVRLWDAVEGQEICKFNAHERVIATVAFTPDGNNLVTGDHESLRVWDIKAMKEVGEKRNISTTCMVFSPNHEKLIIGGYEAIKILDAKTFNLDSSFSMPDMFCSSIAVSSDGERFVTGEYGQMRIWDSRSGEEISSMEVVGKAIHNVVLNPNHNSLLVYGNGVSRLSMLSAVPNLEVMNATVKSRPDPWWHLELAENSETAGNYYAATFHWAWVIKASREKGCLTEPLFHDAPKRLQQAHQEWRRQFLIAFDNEESKPDSSSRLHVVVRQELESIGAK